MVAALRKEFPNFSVLPISARVAADESCAAPPLGQVVIGTCAKDDFVRITYRAMPFWRIAAVGMSTAACGAELTMLNGKIEKNDFNLNISRCVSTAEDEEGIDPAKVHEELVALDPEDQDHHAAAQRVPQGAGAAFTT